MSISNDILLAILSMDAYNRGYNARLTVDGAQIGTATLGVAEGSAAAQAASFFAQSYSLNGETIISYRGTDSPLDALTGWLGGGGYTTIQAGMAFQFYQSVVQQLAGADIYSANIQLTGHSLGAGLAGLIADIYTKRATLFDNMPFELSAQNLFNEALTNDALAQAIYGDNDVLAPNNAEISAWAVSGEVLAPFRLLQSTPVTTLDTGTNFGIFGSGSLGPLQRHDSALLPILLFGKESYDDLGNINWHAIREKVILSLFDNALATAAGIPGAGSGGTASADQKMRMMIAYSAIDSNALVYGDTGIRALYQDSDEVGQLLKSSGVAAYLQDDKVQKALADIIVEYAALLANNKDDSPTVGQTGYGNGALYYDDVNHRLVGDFNRDLWTILNGTKAGQEADIIGKKTVADAVRAGAGNLHRAVSGISA